MKTYNWKEMINEALRRFEIEKESLFKDITEVRLLNLKADETYMDDDGNEEGVSWELNIYIKTDGTWYFTRTYNDGEYVAHHESEEPVENSFLVLNVVDSWVNSGQVVILEVKILGD